MCLTFCFIFIRCFSLFYFDCVFLSKANCCVLCGSFDEFGVKNKGLHGFWLRNISYGDSLKFFFCKMGKFFARSAMNGSDQKPTKKNSNANKKTRKFENGFLKQKKRLKIFCRFLHWAFRTFWSQESAKRNFKNDLSVSFYELFS